jgi:hypothetical protein
MGEIKQLAIQISRMVYEMQMTDEVIIASLKSRFPNATTEWCKNQVKAVRENPETYKGMH